MESTAYLVDKDTVFRHGLKQLLIEKFHTAVINEHHDLNAAVDEIDAAGPDIVFIDVGECIYEGLPAIRRLRSLRPQTKVALLADSLTPTTAQEALAMNLDGYALKPLSLPEFENLYENLIHGRRYVGRGFDEINRPSSEWQTYDRRGFDFVHKRLSERETQILVRTVNGYSATDIAKEFSISVKTAEWHRRNVYSKLHVKNVAQLTKFALRNGIIALD